MSAAKKDAHAHANGKKKPSSAGARGPGSGPEGEVEAHVEIEMDALARPAHRGGLPSPSEDGDGIPGHLRQLIAFLDYRVRHPDEFGEEASVIRLAHVSPDHGREKKIGTYPARKTTNLRDLAESIYANARSYADAMSDRVLFEIKVFYGKRDTSDVLLMFSVVGGREELPEAMGLGGEIAEAATGKGFIAMMMRHSNMVLETGLRERTATNLGYAENMRSLRLQLEEARLANRELRERCHDIEGRHIATLDLLEKLLDRKQEREIGLMAAVKAEDRRDDLVRAAKTIAPVIVNQLAGQNIMPVGNVDQITQMFMGFVDGLKEEHFEKLASVFSNEPHMVMSVMQMIKVASVYKKQLEVKRTAELEKTKSVADDPEKRARAHEQGEKAAGAASAKEGA